MSNTCILLVLCLIPFLAEGRVLAQDSPVEVSLCDLANDPMSFKGRPIRVRATLSVEFEDVSLDTSNCSADQGIWLKFGGEVQVPGKPDVSYQVRKDESFYLLYALVTTRDGEKPAYRATATLGGLLFAEQMEWPNGPHVGGYGHFGCCALLVITDVSDVDSVPSANLDVRGTVLAPDGRPMQGFVVYDDTTDFMLSPQRQQATTNERGEFLFSHSGGVLRFEDPRYRPVALVVKPGGTSVRVRMEPAQPSDWIVLPCPQVGNTGNRVGFSVAFSVPPIMDSSLVSYADWPFQVQYVFPQGGSPSDTALTITNDPTEAADHSSPIVTRAQGPPQQRWIKNRAGAVIGIDSRVEFKAGNPYPNGGFFREIRFWDHDIASYQIERNALPAVLDTIIDSACIANW